MGDEEMEIVSDSKEHSSSSVDLKKKRKLHCGLCILDIPSPKQRQRTGDNIWEQRFIAETQIDLQQAEEKSEQDSNSFTRACDNLTAPGVKAADENSFTLTIYQEQPSTSLNNYGDEVNNITSLSSLESRDAKEVSTAASLDMEETIQFDPVYKTEEEKLTCFGVEHAILEVEDESISKTETMVLCSNDVATQLFFRSSGCWNLGQDSPLGKSKPTIDEEFEQYFSSLML